jgi:integrase
MARRSYGTGSLDVRTDSAGRETWYGKWHANGRRVKRKIGPKRTEGSRDGLTRAQAEAELRRLMAEVRVVAAVGHSLTVFAAGERYQQHLKRAGRKRSTITAVESALRVQLVPFFDDKALDSIRHEDVVDLVRVLEGKGLSPKSIHNYIGTLSALFNFARGPQRRWAAVNPCEGVELPGVPENDEIRFLDEAEWEAVLRNIQPGPYEALDRAFYLTALMVGLRHGELIALRWRDVDWAAMRVRVRQNWVLGEFDTPKSRRATRSVPMADRLAGELDRLYKALGEPDVDALVFADPITGGPLDKAANLRRYRKALRAAALDPTHNLHGLRHTFGTRCAAAGVAMRTLQEWMGHRDIATTQRYADYAPSTHEADLIAAAFGKGDSAPHPALIEGS